MLAAARIFGRKTVDCTKFGFELNGKRNFSQLLNVSEHAVLIFIIQHVIVNCINVEIHCFLHSTIMLNKRF